MLTGLSLVAGANGVDINDTGCSLSRRSAKTMSHSSMPVIYG